jgi:serine/threonine protein phosphatase 1
MDPLPDDFSMICLAGNHEVMMLEHLADPRRDDQWLSLGGTETLMSYGVNISSYLAASQRNRAAILHTHVPLQHIQFLQGLPILVSIPGIVFVHAGLRPELPIEEQDDRDLLWIRPREGMPNKLPTLIVHGHSPVDEVNELDGRINIDTGAFATGRLAGLRLMEGERPHFLVVRATQDG